MKHRNENIRYGMLWIKVILIIAAAIVLCVLGPGCRVNKSSSTTTAASSDVSSRYRDSLRTVDSIAISKRLEEKYKELSSDISFYKGNEEALIQALNELQDTITARGFMSDSLRNKINKVVDSIKANPCRNEVIINKDGSIVFRGQIDKLKLRISEMQRIMDSVANIKKETNKVSEGESSEKTETKTDVKKSVKRGLPGFVIAIIWLVVGYLLCWVLPPKRIVAIIRKGTIRI